jgi:hypothetical protein
VVSKTNPRYFTAGGRAVYLTGSHIWNNLHDGMGPGSACAETPEPFDYNAYLAFLKERGHNFIRLWRWEQFKSAKDGKPKFDLSKFDSAFFDRLRERVIAAGNEGVAAQTKVNDPLFASRADWISPGYDDSMFTGGRHPMAPGAPPSRWYDDPPASDGRKVIITDTDHYAPGKGDALWAWKSFLRGHHPILMDFGLINGVNANDPSYRAFEAARFAMGDTRRYAERMELIDVIPRGDLSSTGYVLANVGKEYLVLQPSATADPFTLQLPAGSYMVEWYNVTSRETRDGGRTTAERESRVSFTSPFGADPAVLYLKRASR